MDRKSIGRGIKRRMEILKGEEPSWLISKRKVRFDAVPEEVKRKVYDFWTTQASRPTGDKKDFVRYHTGKSQYKEHTKHILEKTQTEAFLEFQALHPQIKIKRRKFESLKPFFVKPATERDRKSCLCRKHIEIKIVFGDCMKFHKAVLRENDRDGVSVLASVTEAVELTLCPKGEEAPHHKLACLEQQCERCGVPLMRLLPEKESKGGTVIWRCYKYVSTGKLLANGQEKTKLALVTRKHHHLRCLTTSRVFSKTTPCTPLWPSGNAISLTLCWSTCPLIRQWPHTTILKGTLVGRKMRRSPNILTWQKCRCM